MFRERALRIEVCKLLRGERGVDIVAEAISGNEDLCRMVAEAAADAAMHDGFKINVGDNIKLAARTIGVVRDYAIACVDQLAVDDTEAGLILAESGQ